MADRRAEMERFLFEVDGLGEELRVVRFHGSEAISQLFRFELTVAAEVPDLDFEQVVNKPALLTLEGDSPRYVNGMVSRIEQGGQAGRFTLYEVTLVPAVWRLKLRHDCRIFQEMTVQDIVGDVLDRAGLPNDARRFDLSGDAGEARTFCVQYRETDWDFICRLLEEEGIYYFFEHADDKCVLVMANHNAAQPDIEGDPALPFVPAAGLKAPEEHVTEFSYAEEVRPGKVTITDYYFVKPSLNLASEASGEDFAELEVYDFPGEFTKPETGKRFAEARLAALNLVRRTASGGSVSPRLVPGFQFELTGHPRDPLNAKYVVHELTHTAQQTQVLEELAGGGGMSYVNRFECIPDDVTYRPPRVTPKPVVEGVQTAIVVGPSGEEIYTDEYGRVKVQFHWDRQGARDEHSSCWMRVAQVHAGAGFGGIDIPRIGEEVIVDFVEGDPDRPIITGRVYHGTNRPPYALADNKTQSGYKSNSTPGGDGFNELRFEDKKDSEEIFLHAQKDFNEVVEAAHSRSVGGNENVDVKGERWVHVKGYHNLHVEDNQQITVDGEGGAGFSAVGPYTINSMKKLDIGVDGGPNVTADASNLTISAPAKITLSVGGSTIEITAGGIKMAGPNIEVKGDATVKVGAPSVVSQADGIHDVKGSVVNVSGSGAVKVTGGTVMVNS